MDLIKSAVTTIKSISDSIQGSRHSLPTPPPRKSGIWHKRVLIPLWTLHLLLLIQGVFRVYLDHVVEDSWDLKEGEWISVLDDAVLCICAVLEVSEILAFRKKKLKPGFYLYSQAFKAVFFSWHLWRIFRGRYGRECLRRERYCPELVMHVVQILSFHFGAGYALYIWLLQRRIRRKQRAQASQHERDERWGALIPQGSVNPAAYPDFEAPLIVKLVRWVRKDPAWVMRLSDRVRTPVSWTMWFLRYAVAVLPIIHLLPMTERLAGEPPNKFLSDPPPLEEWDYPKAVTSPPETYKDNDDGTPRPVVDEESAVSVHSLRTLEDEAVPAPPPQPPIRTNPLPQPAVGRQLGPKYLCFLTDPTDGTTTYSTQSVESWKQNDREHREADYVFVSYSRKQFSTQIPDSIFDEDELRERRDASKQDQATLVKYAIAAAKESEVPAFWIDFECGDLQDWVEGDMEDGYRVCDIVRSAHSLTVVTGPTLRYVEADAENDANGAGLLYWGERMWSLPEVLLCPPEHPISIYRTNLDAVEKLSKRELVATIWKGEGQTGELIDHFEGSLQLTQMQLASAALSCLSGRTEEQRAPGDIAYALMGLLRLHPTIIKKTDTLLQALARLSIPSSDEDYTTTTDLAILERLLCLSTLTLSSTKDAWSAPLSSLTPTFHPTSLGPHHTILLSSAHGTTIDYTSLKLIDFKRAQNRLRLHWLFARNTAVGPLIFLLAMVVVTFAIAPVVGRHSDPASSWDFAADTVPILFGLWWSGAAVALPIPWIIARHFRGKMVERQAKVFGLVGKPVSLGKIEERVFGDDMGRLSWNEGSLSPDEDGEDGDDDGANAVFTIIDTVSCTATLFRARKPPSMLFVGGTETDGTLRCLLCSYDVARRAFVKETVVRYQAEGMQSRMPALETFRFCVKEDVGDADKRVKVEGDEVVDLSDVETGEYMDIPEIEDFRSLDD